MVGGSGAGVYSFYSTLQGLLTVLNLPDHACQSSNPLRMNFFLSPREAQPEIMSKYALTVPRVTMDLECRSRLR